VTDEEQYVTRAEMIGMWKQRDMERDGLQTLERSQRVTDGKVDDVKASVDKLASTVDAAVKAWPLARALLIMPTVVATFVLLRVLWILRGTIFEDAQALLAMVSL
jgi:hypothetical protein